MGPDEDDSNIYEDEDEDEDEVEEVDEDGGKVGDHDNNNNNNNHDNNNNHNDNNNNGNAEEMELVKWVECGSCKQWFHCDCMEIDENDLEQINYFNCGCIN